MSVILVFLLVIAGISVWWLGQHRFLSKPWLEHGPVSVPPTSSEPAIPTEKIGLAVFLAVVGCLFALFASAFFMRMEYPDWQTMRLPGVIYLNTAVLLAGSVALHSAVLAARKDDEVETVRIGLATGTCAALAFLVGQFAAWRSLAADGYFLTTNPANSFFYMLTAAHGLHILGGFVALAAVTAAAWTGARPGRLPLRVELCAMYMHFLLFVWLVLLVFLLGWAKGFVSICRQLLT